MLVSRTVAARRLPLTRNCKGNPLNKLWVGQGRLQRRILLSRTLRVPFMLHLNRDGKSSEEMVGRQRQTVIPYPSLPTLQSFFSRKVRKGRNTDTHATMEAIQPHHPKPSRNRLIKILSESGLVSLYQSTRDVKILCLQRFVRLFSYGGSTFVLVSFLEALGISKTRIGLFMTLTIAGDVCISFVLTLFADRIGRKAVLALGAVLMVGSGVLFALSDDFYVLLAAATLGVISPR